MSEQMTKKVGDSSLFTGGAEKTPSVTVCRYYAPSSMNDGRKILQIEQDGAMISVSPETMKSILDWYQKE